MEKERVLTLIIKKLNEDLSILFQAAKTAHEVSTDQENIPDNKYDTLSDVVQIQVGRDKKEFTIVEVR